MKKAIILDDEQSAINILQDYLEKHVFIELVGAVKTMEAAEGLILEHKPDLLFLDIRIKGQYVFSMLERLKNRHLHFAIVFVTGFYQEHLEDAIQSCGFQYPFSYIGKPIDPEILEAELEKYQIYSAGYLQENPARDSIMLKQRDGFARIRFNDIVYCMSDGNYCDLYLAKGNQLRRKNTRRSLLDLENLLPSTIFFRMSSKHLINTEYFDEVVLKGKERLCILRHERLQEPVEIPIPENKWRMFKERLF